jgi:hypothetical protein
MRTEKVPQLEMRAPVQYCMFAGLPEETLARMQCKIDTQTQKL